MSSLQLTTCSRMRGSTVALYSSKSTPSSWLSTCNAPHQPGTAGRCRAARRTSKFLPTRSRSSCRSFSRRSCRHRGAACSRAQARLAERHAGQRRTLSREGPWCCMRTQSLFICWQACKSAALPQPRLHRARLREVLQNEVHSILWFRRRRSTVSQASRERRHHERAWTLPPSPSYSEPVSGSRFLLICER